MTDPDHGVVSGMQNDDGGSRCYNDHRDDELCRHTPWPVFPPAPGKLESGEHGDRSER